MSFEHTNEKMDAVSEPLINWITHTTGGKAEFSQQLHELNFATCSEANNVVNKSLPCFLYKVFHIDSHPSIYRTIIYQLLNVTNVIVQRGHKGPRARIP